MYKILGTDQKEYGPASADQIRQWIADGRATPQMQAKIEGTGDWKSLSEFPEFAAALATKYAAPVPRPSVAPGSPPPMPVNSPAASGLAKTSLVLGVLSFLGCFILTGIPAIITGHIAHNRSRKEPQRFGGGGLAVAGLVLGYLSVALIPVIAVLAGLLLPALAKAKEKAQRINCVSNLKQVGLAARMWSNDHNGRFPPDFISMSNELYSPKILVCPGDSSKTRVTNWSEFGPGNVSYEYLQPGFDEKSGQFQTVVFQCPIHGNIGLADGSVQQGNQRMRRIGR
jgi:hypothetical protein